MTERYDIAILGGGNAGFGVSAVAAAAGKRIAFVEERDFGGTCPNRGCTPKKVLVAAAHAMHDIETAPVHGIEVSGARLDWARLIARKDEMIGFIPDAMAGVAEKRGDVYRGTAQFVGPDRIQVGDRVLEADNIVIATGSTPRMLPIPGAEHMITSDEVLSDAAPPGDVVFVGGGVIGMEFAHVYARAGARVTVLEALPRLLPRLDGDAVDQLRLESERIGIAIRTEVRVAEIRRAGTRFEVVFEHEGERHVLACDRVVNGTGRVANVAGLDLEAGDIAHDGIRVQVDESLRSTSNPRVWVAGDALVGPAQLSPLATLEGQIVGRNIVHGTSEAPDYAVVPSAVYTVPALAGVGLSEADAREQGLDVDVAVNDMTGWFSARSYGESVAWSKVLTEKASGRIVGAHIVGHRGEELIHLFAFAMKFAITADQIKETIFGFPTFASDIKNLL